ncbi:hypothetical protein PIB30_059676 [Stylosanthes scabra]|uniref:Uncharacterized protein n=1 Tax=Stylosanthes scabra TaxID=79078 RepID=A0ABU6YKM2_9FABA|nr:hypothetical protein [Stylosanthes scabra]
MKIEDVVKIVEEGHAWIVACVVALNVGARDRYYKGYGNCGKKVDTAPKGIYECGQCQHTSDDFKFKRHCNNNYCGCSGGMFAVNRKVIAFSSVNWMIGFDFNKKNTIARAERSITTW